MRLSPVSGLLDEVGDVIAAAEAVFTAAITRRPPPPPVASFKPSTISARPAITRTNLNATAAPLQPAIMPAVFLTSSTTSQSQPTIQPVRQDNPPKQPVTATSQPDPAQTAENLRSAVFDDNVDIHTVAHNRRMTEQEVLDSIGQAPGVKVQTVNTSRGTDYTITDAKPGKQISIVHDGVAGTDSTTTIDAKGQQTTTTIGSDGVTTHSTFDPKTGATTSTSTDPKTKVTTKITAPKNGPISEVDTDANGKKTVKVTDGDYTTTTAPDGKVTVRDNVTGAQIVLTSLSYDDALSQEKTLLDELATANTRLKQLQQDETTLSQTPTQDQGGDYKTRVAQNLKDVADAQAKVDQLTMDHVILVDQFKVSQAKPGTSDYKAAITTLLDDVHTRDRVIANDKADQKVGDTGLTLAQANANLARYGIFDKAVTAYRGENSYLFDPNGFTNLNNDYSGKLEKQEVIVKDGQIYLRNTYEHGIFDGSHVLEIQITFAPGKAPRNRSDAGKQVDTQWQSDGRSLQPTTCTVSQDDGWGAAKTAQKQASNDYQSALSGQAKTQKVDIDATIPDLKQAYNDAVKKYGAGSPTKPTTPAPKGHEPVQIQINGKTSWVDPNVAAAYLALTLAQGQSSELDVQQQQADNARHLLNLQFAEPAVLLNDVGSDDYEDQLWARHSDALLNDGKTLDNAMAKYGSIQSDLLQTETGVEQANIAAWRQDNPTLAGQVDLLEGKIAQEGKGSNKNGSATSGNPVQLAAYTRPPNFIGPVAMTPESADIAKLNTLLATPAAQPLVLARQQLSQLQQQQQANTSYIRNVATDQDWTKTLQGMSPSDRANTSKRNDAQMDFARKHAQSFADPAQSLQQQLGSQPVTVRNASDIKPLVRKVAQQMAQANAGADVDHVVNQILNSPQINGDHPGASGPLQVKPIAMQYEASGVSMTTGMFQVTNSAGQSFLVDMAGHIWNDENDFLDHNTLYSDKGILLLPKNLDTSKAANGGIAYEARTARNLSWSEKWFDPAVGILTGAATIASFIPVVDVVAAPIAMAGGTYLGAKAVANQVEYLQHGGSWGDGESITNMLQITTAALPVMSGGVRLIGLAKEGVPLLTATGAISGFGRDVQAAKLMQASIFGREGSLVMRTARGLDGTGLIAGVPQMALAANNLRYWDQMSGLDKANALMGLGAGIFSAGMGYRNLRRTAPDGKVMQPPAGNGNAPKGGPQGGPGANPAGGNNANPAAGMPQVSVAGSHPSSGNKSGAPDIGVNPPAGSSNPSLPIEPAVLRSMEPEEIANLSTDDVAAIDAGHIPQLRPDQIAALTNDHISALSAKQIAALTGKQWRAMSTDQLQAVNPEAIPAIVAGRLPQMKSTQPATFTPEQIARLTPAQVAKLTPDQLAAFHPKQIGALTGDQMAALRSRQFRKLSVTQMQAINPDVIPAIAFDQLQSSQQTSLTPDQIAKLTAAQLGMLTPDQWAAMSPEQISGLTVDQVAGLTSTQLSVLSKEQIEAINPDAIPSIDPADLTPEQIGAFNYAQTAELTPAQLAKFTPEQVTAMSPEQLYIVREDADWDDTHTANLSNDQKKGLEAPVDKGFKQKLHDLRLELSTYLWVGGTDVTAYMALPPGVRGPVGAVAYAVRGFVFVAQSIFPNATAGTTRLGRILSGIASFSFTPNIPNGVMSTPADPLVNGTFGVGSIPFSTSAAQRAISTGNPPSRIPQHVGNILFTIGSIAYMPEAIRSGDPAAIAAGATFAYGCPAFYLSFLRGGWKARAEIPKPAPEMTRYDKAASWLDQKAGKIDGALPNIDRSTLAIFGAGLLLFSYMGLKPLFASDSGKKDDKTPSTPDTGNPTSPAPRPSISLTPTTTPQSTGPSSNTPHVHGGS